MRYEIKEILTPSGAFGVSIKEDTLHMSVIMSDIAEETVSTELNKDIGDGELFAILPSQWHSSPDGSKNWVTRWTLVIKHREEKTR